MILEIVSSQGILDLLGEAVAAEHGVFESLVVVLLEVLLAVVVAEGMAEHVAHDEAGGLLEVGCCCRVVTEDGQGVAVV